MKQTGPYFFPPYDNLAAKLQELESRVNQLEQNNAQVIPGRPMQIENLYVRRLYTEKLQFKLDTIDVQELSGMLSIGINKGGKFNKKEIKKTNGGKNPAIDKPKDDLPKGWN